MNTRPVELMIAALIHSFSKVFTDRPSPPTVFNEGHGRESFDGSLDVSETVGWFTTLSPIQIDASAKSDILNTVARVKDCMCTLPANGWAYFSSRMLHLQGRPTFGAPGTEEIVFNNCVGVTQQDSSSLSGFKILDDDDASEDPWRSFASERRFALFDVVANIKSGRLEILFVYNTRICHQDKIKEWMTAYEQALADLPTLLNRASHKFTLTDFPLAFSDYAHLRAFEESVVPSLGISNGDLEDIYPCTSTQEGILISQSRRPELYRVRFEVEVWPEDFAAAPVNVHRLSLAWSQVVQRHPILRSVFLTDMPGSGFAQLVLTQSNPRVQILSDDQPHGARSTEVRAETSPDHGVCIWQEEGGCVIFELEINHVYLDAHSYNLVLRDLQLAYSGKLSVRAPLATYRDYVAYALDRNSPAASSSRKDSQGYWSQRLANVKPCHFPAIDGHSSSTVIRHVKAPTVDHCRLQAFCQSNEVTVSSVCQVAWALVLQAYDFGNSRPCFGNVSSGREHPIDNNDEIVGPMIVTLPSVISLEEDVTLLDLVSQAQREHVQSMDHNLLPLSEILHELHTTSKPFNTAISVNAARRSAEDSPGEIRLKTRGGDDPTEFDIAVQVASDNDTTNITLMCSASILSERATSSVAEAFTTAISSIISNPLGLPTDVDLVGPYDLQQIWQWNDHLAPQSEKLLHDLVHEQVSHRPDATAVSAFDGNFTYSELARLSQYLALQLSASGLQVGSLVPFCVEKSKWAVVAMLAILKAGGAFVPLDPGHPASRHEEILQQIKPQVVIASADCASLSVFSSRAMLVVDAQNIEKWATLGKKDQIQVATDLPITSAAYCIFTSGSSGKPKGVVVEHRQISTSCLAHSIAHRTNEKSRVLQFSAYVFDACIQEIFTTLVVGGCICIPSETARLSALGPAIQELGVNWAVLTPSISSTLAPTALRCLKTLVLCGERVTANAIQDWDCVDNVMVGYGPSESSIVCVTGNVTAGELAHRNKIGRSVGSRSWIVKPSNHDKLLPIGAVGELIVEGPIVARGYLNDEDKTKRSFITNPAWLSQGTSHAEPHSRLYKTGDLVQYAIDGSIDFIGRQDDQIKINGQRVELRDIEHHISQCLPTATAIVVESVMVHTQHSILIAFLQLPHRVSTSNCPQQPALLLEEDNVKAVESLTNNSRELLQKRLPPHMLPKLYLSISTMPMTTSGKTDRRCLRDMASQLTPEQVGRLQGSSMSNQPVVTPRTPAEGRLRELWADVLGAKLDSISIEDEFFRLGGDSLSAIRLASSARESGLIISVGDIFLHPKLRELASVTRIIEESETSNTSLHAPEPFALLPIDLDASIAKGLAAASCGVDVSVISNIYPCSALQEGMMALSLKHPGEYIVCHAVELKDDVVEQRLREAWEATYRGLSILRTRIAQLGDSGLYQVVIQEPLPWTETHESMDDHISHSKANAVDLGQPLARFTLLRPSDDSQRRTFVFTVHHALFDGVSLPLILDLVHHNYRDPTSITAPITTGFDNFIEYLVGLSETDSRQFWTSYFDDLDCSHFPQHLERFIGEPRHATSSCTLGADRDFSITIATLAKAAWALVVSRHTASSDVVFGYTVSGRNAPIAGIETMVGPTVATVPTRVTFFDHEQTADAFLGALQRDAASMIPHEQAGLAKIAACSAEGEAACNFQTLMIVYPDESAMSPMHSFGEWLPDRGGASIRTYPLVLRVQRVDRALTIQADYDPTCIGEVEIAGLLEQLVHTIPQLVSAKPGTKVRDITTTTPIDLAKIWQWNLHAYEDVQTCVHELIAKQVSLRPNAPAVTSWDGSLSYSELDRLSTHLALHLHRLRGVAKCVVPQVFEKSSWMSVAVLAIMKAGGASVLLDIDLPEARLRSITEQVSSSLILCSEATERIASAVSAHQVVRVDRLLCLDLPPGNGSGLPRAMPSDPLYCVMTSGSTGLPKGVIITHSNFSSASKYQQKQLQFDQDCRVFDYVSYAFDVAWSNMLHTWLSGGCLCVPSAFERQNNIAGAMEQMAVNYAHLTPSVGRMIDPAKVPSLRVLSFIGEPLAASDVTRWSGTHVSVINTYGPAEATVTSTIQHADTDDTTHDPSIGVGAGLNAWIVEPTHGNHLVGIGNIGELVLEGPLVGAGYMNDTQKTAAVFIDSPPWLEDGPSKSPTTTRGRCYKTGDLVKYNGDGKSLTFIGRRDGQVKIRGQRIELGEVAHHVGKALCLTFETERVELVAETIKPHSNSNRPILAIFYAHTFRGGHGHQLHDLDPATVSEINENLATQLPSAMIPTIYHCLERIPLAPTGKTDRKRLREIGADLHYANVTPTTPALNGSDRYPLSYVEETLRHVWARIFKRPEEEIGLHNTFLGLGGDSITAMQVVAACRAQGLNIQVANIFKQKTIAGLAALLKQQDLGLGTELTDNNAIQSEDIATASSAEPLQSGNIHVGERSRQERLAQIGLAMSEVEDILPCSPVQQGILLRQATNSRLYQLRFDLLVAPLPAKPELDSVRLEKAWQAVVKRHPALRTVFIEDFPGHDGFTQVVLRKIRKDADLAARPAHSLEIQQAQHGKAAHFILHINHALVDAHSVDIILQDLTAIYSCMPSTRVVPYKQYVDYALRQPLQEAKEYWRRRLLGVEPCTIEPNLGVHPKDSQTIEAPSIDHKQLKDFCNSLGVTAATVFQVAWALVLRAYTRNDIVCFGFATSGRDLPIEGIESMVGLLVNILPTVITFEQSSLIADIILKAQDKMLEAMQHQLLPLVEILHDSQPGTPQLFSTVMSVTNRSADHTANHCDEDDDDEGPDISFTACGGEDQTEFDIAVQVLTGSSSTKVTLNTSSVSHDLALSIAATLSTAVNSILSTSTLQPSVRELDITSSHDIARIERWNAIRPGPSNPPSCLHDRVHERAVQDPLKPAISSWDGQLTYDQLDELTDQIAHALVAKGVTPETLVPICFEHSLYAIVAMLGVLKAGAAYVPLDIEWPLQRCREIIAQAHASTVLASAAGAQLLSMPEATVVVDAHMSLLGQVAPLPKVDGSAVAYVLFTSGSTGRPKGVIMEHSAAVTSCSALSSAMWFTPNTRALQFSSYIFDGCIMEIFTTLLCGGCVCIPSDTQRQDNLEDFMIEHNVNWTFQTPSRAHFLDLDRLQGQLDVLLVGGEAVLESDRELWCQAVPHFLVVYGPTEACVVCLVADYSRDLAGGQPHHSKGNIGRSLTPSSRSWIADPHDISKLVPFGAIGELLIEGPVLARGYLDDPSKTAASFIKVQVMGEDARVYRTGDLVKYTADGSVTYLGRSDEQIKVDGHRIEVGEVESRICGFLAAVAVVVEAVTLAGRNSQTLVAFIQFDDTEAPAGILIDFHHDPNQIRRLDEELMASLPPYMVPRLYVPTTTLPTTIAGKTDRRALRNMASSLSTSDVAKLQSSKNDEDNLRIERPCSATEKALCRLWANVLGLDEQQIGRQSHFVRLGGDSLTALRLSSKARKDHLVLPVSRILRNPILHDMSQAVQSINGNHRDLDVEPFSLLPCSTDVLYARRIAAFACNTAEEDVVDIYPCTPLQEAMLALSSSSKGDYVACFVLELRPDVDLAKLKTAWQHTMVQSPILRTRIAQIDRLGICQIVTSEHDIEWTQIIDTEHYIQQKKSFPPGLGAKLVDFAIAGCSQAGGHSRRELVWTIHHSLFDGWSLSIILRMVVAYYRGDVGLPPVVDFKHFIAHVIELQQDDGRAGFWQSYFSNLDTILFPSPAKQLTSTFRNECEVHGKLERFCSLQTPGTSEVTAASLVRAAWALVLSRHTGCPDIVFGETRYGRSADVAGIQRTVGPTIATIPVRVFVDQSMPVFEFLSGIQAQSTDLFRFEQTSLREIRSFSTDCAKACQFQTLLIVQPSEQQSLNEHTAELGTWHYEGSAAIHTYPLVIQFEMANSGVALSAAYDTRTISSVEVQRLFEQVAHALPQLVLHPKSRISELQTLTPTVLEETWAAHYTTPVETSPPDISKMRPQSSTSIQARTQPADPAETTLRRLIANVLDQPELSIGLDDDFFSIGGDSVSAMQLAASCKMAGLTIHVGDIMREKTCASLAAHAAHHMKTAKARHTGESQNLTLVQQYLLSLDPDQIFRYHHSFAIELGSTTYEHIRSMLNELVNRHPVLQACFCRSEASKVNTSSDLENSFYLRHCMVDRGPAAALASANSSTSSFAMEEAVLSMRKSLYATSGPLLAATLFDLPGSDRSQVFTIVIHCLSNTLMHWKYVCQEICSLLPVSTKVLSPKGWTLGDFPLAFTRSEDLFTFQDSILPSLKLITHNIQDVYACSPVQKGILVGQINDSESYFVRYELEIRRAEDGCDVNVQDLVGAWLAVVRHHAILRTVVITNMPGSGFAQIVLREIDSDVRCISIDEAVKDGQGSSAQDIEERTRLPAISPEHRVTIASGKAGTVFFTLTISHALIDAFTFNMLVRDLRMAYSGLSLPAAVPYKDYIAYSQCHSSKQDAMAYWSSRLVGVEACHFPSEGIEAPRVITEIEVPSVDHEQLRNFCSATGTTASSVFFTAWALILHAYTNARPCFGWIASGRDLPIEGVERIAGPLITTLPFTLDVSAKHSVQDVVRGAQSDIAEALQHQLVPLTDIQHMLRLGSTKLFNTGVSVRGDNQPHGTDADSKIDVRSCGGHDPSEFDIAVQIYHGIDGVRISLMYAPSVAKTISSVASAFSAAISSIIESPESNMGFVNLVGRADLHQILSWNSSEPEATHSALHALIATTTSQQPTQPAVCSWDGDLTYEDLDILSTMLAQRIVSHLNSLGISSAHDTYIPVCFEKSRWAVVSMLAVLKAGCAFVPIDSKHLRARHQELISQTAAILVLASPACAEVLSLPASVGTMVIDEELMATISSEPLPDVARKLPVCSLSDPLYVIFTSGSTGKPKGVVMEHGAVSTSCLAHGKAMGFSKSSRVLQFSSYDFDGCIMELFTTLIYGGCICVPSEGDRTEYDALSRFISERHVNWVFLTPSLARCLPLDSLRNLDVLVVGGEVLTETDRRNWSQLKRFIVAYGPTECCVICFTADYSTDPQEKASIGKAITPAWRSWITDPASNGTRLLPIGAMGELLVEGPPLARGYLNNAEKTNEAFMQSPDWLSGSRLYRTGDLVKYNIDGSISFVGRKDLQVKINGQRVEVGEIEQRIRDYLPDAKAVVVEPAKLQGRVAEVSVAFLQLSVPSSPDYPVVVEEHEVASMAKMAAALDKQLGASLPSYMVPNFYVPLTRIPLAISTKADRRLLQRLGANLSTERLTELRGQESIQGPRTDTERHLAQHWAQVLGLPLETVGINDNFFWNGGDSISAMNLVGVARSGGLSFSVKDVFSTPTIAELARISDTAQNHFKPEVPGDAYGYAAFSLLEQQRPDISPQKLDDDLQYAFPATHIQSEFIQGALQETMLLFNYFCINFNQHVDSELLRSACRTLLDAHEALRTVFDVLDDGTTLQAVLKSMSLNYSVHELPPGGNADGFINNICTQDSRQSFEPHMPLTKFFLMQDASTSNSTLILRLSHAQYDGVSINILYNDLRSALEGQPISTSIPFSRYVHHTLRHNRNHYPYWREQLEGTRMTTLAPRSPTYRAIHAERKIQFPSIPGITPATLFTAAWALTLSKYTCASDVLFGQVVAGRNASLSGGEDMMQVFGPCINKIPVRLRITPDTSPSKLLTAVQEQQAGLGSADAVTLPEITEHCTDWEQGTEWGCVVQYQNTNIDATAKSDGGWRARWIDVGAVPDRGVFVLCTPEGNGGMHKVELDSNRMGLRVEGGEEILQVLAEVVEDMAESGA